MQFNTRRTLISAAILLISSPVFAVDLVGVHDLAAKSDPALQAAAFRRDATGENERQAWSNLLPTLSGSAGMNRGGSETSINGTKVDDSDSDTESWGLNLRQSLYAQSNYERMFTLLTSVLSGVNFLMHGLGILESYLTISYEQFIIDLELLAMVQELVRPLEVSESTLALDTINQVDWAGSYMPSTPMEKSSAI